MARCILILLLLVSGCATNETAPDELPEINFKLEAL